MNQVVEISAESFNREVTKAEKPVVIEFWIRSCHFCQKFNPIYERIAEKYLKHTFSKLDTLAEKQLVARLGIEHIPTLLLYRDGILLFQQPGYFEEEKLEDILLQAERLDMNEVRAHIASEKDETERTNDPNS